MTWRMNAQLLSDSKMALPKEAWICKLWVKLFWVSTMVDLPAACQLSVKKYCTECRLQVVYSGRGGGGVCESRKSTISVMSGLFLHNCITLSSPNCTNILCHCRVGHPVLFRSERSVLFRSFKESNILLRSFFWVFGDLWNPKERCILFLRT